MDYDKQTVADWPLALSVEQLAKHWQVSGQHIRNMAKRGEVKCFKLGSLTRFRFTDIVAHETQPEPELSAQPPPVSEVARVSPSHRPPTDLVAWAAAQRIKARRAMHSNVRAANPVK